MYFRLFYYTLLEEHCDLQVRITLSFNEVFLSHQPGLNAIKYRRFRDCFHQQTLMLTVKYFGGYVCVCVRACRHGTQFPLARN
jgi:hypothetical protein